jgi:myo-inositol 2-dehydrogenase / D-chiro-inositol 1-dehydrogenase
MERFEESYIIQLKDFIEKAHAGKEPSVTIEDGERALLVAHAATHSLHQKLPVVIDNEAMEFNLKTEIEDEKITG